MIIHIDHVALELNDWQRGARLLSDLGYNPKFCESGLQNPAIKKELTKNFSDAHDLYFFYKTGSFNIELLCYGLNCQNRGRNGYIMPVMENIPAKLIVKKSVASSVATAAISGLAVPIYLKDNKELSEFRFNKFVIPTNYLEASLRFWQLFGFKRSSLFNNWEKLSFATPWQKDGYQIFLQPVNYRRNYFLDDIGFNCLALVSSSAAKERLLLKKRGVIVTDLESMEISGKKLEIFFAQGPSGELVEVITVLNEPPTINN